MKFKTVRRLLVRFLIGIIVISNFYITIQNGQITENSFSKGGGGTAAGKVTENVALYAVSAPGIPRSLKAASASYNSIKISWGSVTGASGYAVYRATSSKGSYSFVSSTTSTSYTNKSLTTGKTYYYKVKAYKTVGTKKVYSSYSAAVSAKPVPSVPAGVKVSSSSYNSIKATWGAVSGASGYQIYRATSSTDKYSLVSTISGTSYTNTGLTTGKTYYYKVRAYKIVGNSKVYGSYSTVVSTKPVPAVPASVTASAVSSTSIKILWKAVTGASGYQIYRATTSAGSYTPVGTTTATSYTNTGLTTGNTYYYKVRAYKTMGTAKIYGNYSAVAGRTAVINVTSVSLNKTIANLTIGDTVALAAAISPSNATNKAVKWVSSKPLVATVGSTGKVTAVSAGTATITVTTVDGNKTAKCTVTVNNIKGYVVNPELEIDLKIRTAPSINGTVLGYLYNFETVEILDTLVDDSNRAWNKIIYNSSYAYVSDAYVQRYTSPPDSVISVASSITKQFEVGTADQIAGNFDGQGLSLGYLQWCIGQGTLQPLLNRMDRQYNSEMRSIFGTNYNSLHSMILDILTNQLNWAKSINDSTNKIEDPWYSQLVNLTQNQHFKNIEKDAEVFYARQAMAICDKYKLNTIRGFALAFDIAVQNGSISSGASTIIDTALKKNPNMTEKDLLKVIANAIADSSTSNSDDIRSRKMAIVNGQGTVHGSMLYLDKSYGLSDNCWR